MLEVTLNNQKVNLSASQFSRRGALRLPLSESLGASNCIPLPRS